MATAYCTDRELKDVYPHVDDFDNKVPIYGWVVVSGSKYAAHNSGLVTQLFVDGESLGAAQSAHTDLNVEGEWFYNSTDDVLYYYSASNPNDKLMEAGEYWGTLKTRYRENASRYLESKIDKNLPREQFKDKDGNYDYVIVRTTALLAAAFLIRSHDPTSEVAGDLWGDFPPGPDEDDPFGSDIPDTGGVPIAGYIEIDLSEDDYSDDGWAAVIEIQMEIQL